MSEIITVMVFLIAAFSFGDLQDERDGVAELSYKAQPKYYAHQGHEDGINGDTVGEGDSVIVERPDGTLRLCTKKGLFLFCTDV